MRVFMKNSELSQVIDLDSRELSGKKGATCSRLLSFGQPCCRWASMPRLLGPEQGLPPLVIWQTDMFPEGSLPLPTPMFLPLQVYPRRPLPAAGLKEQFTVFHGSF